MTASPPSDATRGRWKFLAVVALFFGPLLLAVGWYTLAPQTAPPPGVHGSLIDPARPLDPFELARPEAGGAYTLDDLRGKWTLVHVINARCDDACRKRLHFTRQIHIALGKDQDRVRRLVLAPRGRATEGLAGILAEHPRLTVLTAAPGDPLRRQLPRDVDAATVLLIDPLGNLMLRFGPEVEADGILKDLEKLLKLSRIG